MRKLFLLFFFSLALGFAFGFLTCSLKHKVERASANIEYRVFADGLNDIAEEYARRCNSEDLREFLQHLSPEVLRVTVRGRCDSEWLAIWHEKSKNDVND